MPIADAINVYIGGMLDKKNFIERTRHKLKKELLMQLHANFEECKHIESEEGTEFWLARNMQKLLGYSKWENFAKVIEKAKKACENANNFVADHFLDIREMVEVGSGAQRNINDIMLSRYACNVSPHMVCKSFCGHSRSK